MILRFNSQQEFDAFWQITERYLDRLCRLQTSIKLDTVEGKDDQRFLLKLHPIRPQDLFGLLTTIAEISGQFMLQHCCQRMLQKILAATLNQQYDSVQALWEGTEKNCQEQEYENKRKELTANATDELDHAMRLIDLEFENKLNLELLKYLVGMDGKAEGEIRAFMADCLRDPLQLSHRLVNDGELVFDPQGYFDFRLSFFKPLAQKAVFTAISKDMESKEYQQLLETLRSFLKLQKPVTSVLHIILQENGNFTLLDEKGFVIREQEIISELELAQELGCGYDDTLATAIISLAPQRIVFHQHQEQQQNATAAAPFKINQMILDILEQQIEYCYGCSLCEKAKMQEEKKITNKITNTTGNKKEYQLTRP